MCSSYSKVETSHVKSLNHDEVGTPAVSVSPFIMTAGIVINPQAKRSFEFSVTRSQEKSEFSDTLKASLRIRFLVGDRIRGFCVDRPLSADLCTSMI